MLHALGDAVHGGGVGPREGATGDNVLTSREKGKRKGTHPPHHLTTMGLIMCRLQQLMFGDHAVPFGAYIVVKVEIHELLGSCVFAEGDAFVFGAAVWQRTAICSVGAAVPFFVQHSLPHGSVAVFYCVLEGLQVCGGDVPTQAVCDDSGCG